MKQSKLEVVGDIGEVSLGPEWKIVKAKDLPQDVECRDYLKVKVDKMESVGKAVIIEFS